MLFPQRAGVAPYPLPAMADFAPPSGRALGNQLPPVTGTPDRPFRPGPGPSAGGQLGNGDGFKGADPFRPPLPDHTWQPQPQGGTNTPQQRRFRHFGEGGAFGTNKQTVVDRHAYFDAGTKRTGVTRSVPGNPPNPITDGPARPDLRLTQRTVSWQIGSDNTTQQDDLTRGYTWVGEQGSGWSPVYGGVPGLYQPYGTRGGVPLPVVSPAGLGEPGDGRRTVWAGPPHGLHSETLPDSAQTIARAYSVPQTRPVRQDRPQNSPQAGQSYSQTVLGQGQTGAGRGGARGVPGGRLGMGAGWRGRQR